MEAQSNLSSLLELSVQQLYLAAEMGSQLIGVPKLPNEELLYSIQGFRIE